MNEVEIKAKKAYNSSLLMANFSSEDKKVALESIAKAIWNKRLEIIKANKKDLEYAKTLVNSGEITEAIYKRLILDEAKIQKIIDMVRSVALLPDPVGETLYSIKLDDGLDLYRVTSPIGVIGFIFESRPDALVQIASLCLKSGNSCLLKGGSEAKNSNMVLFEIIREATSNLPDGWIQLLEARQQVRAMLELDRFVNLIIPRGSNKFVRYIQDNTRIPVLGHSEGVCNIYVDYGVDINMAVNVCHDSKVQYPAVCNAVDCILVHKDVAESFIPLLIKRLKKDNVKVRGDNRVQDITQDEIETITESDVGAEYLDYIVGLRIVDGLEEAVDYINQYGSHHTDAILTLNEINAKRFMSTVDSASVFWNASTRFADGYRYGLGAEVGISTGKIHARGPTGLEGLISYKYYLKGDGHIVSDYIEKNREFKHITTENEWS
jgi:glutamate-5-semialdehyde dehydrogenase